MDRTARADRRDAATVGILALFDMTGLIIYRVMRRRLAAAQAEGSASQPFRSSADLIFRAQRDAVEASRGTNR